MKLKRIMIENLKHVRGWRTGARIIVLSVDDYGNVRLDSNQARKALDKAGVNRELSRFDRFDTLETRDDLEALYETLESVQDRNGRHAVLTPFSVPCNFNFEEMAVEQYARYISEDLPQTFQKLSQLQSGAYKGTWDLWREGIAQGLMKPQFHGREHFNLRILEEKLADRDHEVLTALKNRSYTSISSGRHATISVMAAFDFWGFEETSAFDSIIRDGLARFESVFGYRARHFNAPAGREHPVIHRVLRDKGVCYLDAPFVTSEHQGRGRSKYVVNFTGKRSALGQIFIVRNVVFEPTNSRSFDSVGNALRQIETAFRWKCPAVVSSHRVNFCGHIDESNRKYGLNALQELLKTIVKRWPDVSFMSADELGDHISENSKL